MCWVSVGPVSARQHWPKELKLDPWLFLRKLLVYFKFFDIITLWEGRGPSFEQKWIPLTQRYIVPSLVEIDTKW